MAKAKSARPRFPLRKAYPFAERHHLAEDVAKIRSMKITWNRPYGPTVRRGYMIDLFDRKNILERFMQRHWPGGLTAPGQAERRSCLRIKSEFDAYASGNPVPIAEEVAESEGLIEGALRRITVNAYERCPRARDACTRHYGTVCCICGFDFGEVYGPEAEGFTHVHHLKRLSDIGEGYEVDPIADLRPVCPNRHAVIHLGGCVRRIDEVQALLQKERRIASRSRSNDER
jgi:predicted HNH restriction endonuclease